MRPLTPLRTQIEEPFQCAAYVSSAPSKHRRQRVHNAGWPLIVLISQLSATAAPLKLHRFAFSLRELKGDRRASLLIGSGKPAL